MTFQDLVADLADWLKDPKLIAKAPKFITLAEAHFRRTIKFHDREGTVTINALDIPPAVLVNLTLSSSAFVVNTPVAVAILGKTPGSTVTATSSDMTTLTVNGSVINGTFSTLGSPTITLTETYADASNSPHASDPIIISIVAALVISGAAPAGTIGTPYTYTPTVTGGAGMRTFQLTGTLPAGLTFDVTTGTISGTPTVSGLSNLSITVTDATDTDTLAITINVGDADSVYSQYAAILEDW